MNGEFSTPGDAGETSSDFDAQLAAEGAISVDKSVLPRREIEIIRQGNEKLDQTSQWHVPELEIGDIYRRGVTQPITRTGVRLFCVPILSRTVIKETDRHARQGEKVVKTWSAKPNDAVFVKKTGTQPGGLQRKSKGHSLLQISESYWLIERAVWQLTLFWPDSKLIEMVNELTDLATWSDVKGALHPCGLSETRWALWTDIVPDGENRWVNLKADLAGAYRVPNGPSRDDVQLARERYHELKRTLPQYPNPNTTGAAPSLRVVNGPSLEAPWSNDDDAPSPDPNDPGPTPYDDINF